jgi:hypothetical protein
LVIIWECIIQLKIPDLKSQIGNFLLLATAFSTAISALMGLFLAKEVGYEPDNITWHQWSGITVSMLTLLWYSYREYFRKNNKILYGLGALSFVAIILTGHQGANITHGENFLFAPLIPEKQPVQVLLEDAVVYTHLVKPIIEEKCLQCHNSGKAKGNLNMETVEFLLKGGKNGKLWDTTAQQFGLLMQRIHLPLDEKKHMPPKGKPQLTEEEIQILHYWIKKGSDFKLKVVDLKDKDTLKLLAQRVLKPLENEQFSFSPASASMIQKLNSDYRIIYPIALNSPALAVDFFGLANFKSSQLTDLQAIKENIVALNLNKMPVQNADLKTIAQFSNLRKLNLAFTQISGANLGELKKLKELKSLSLAGTKVKPQDLSVLKGMEKLSAIYLWNTQVTEKELISLKKIFPKTHLESGFKSDTVSIKLNSPIIETENQIFKDKIIVKLKHYLKGVNIRYTLNGKDPDSLNSPIYKDGINITQTGELKVKAFLNGWQSSSVVSRKYFKSTIKADSIQLVNLPSEKYKALGSKSLQDGEKGDFNFRSGMWLGYNGSTLEAFLYFDKMKKIQSVGISALINANSHILPPVQIEVWGGEDKDKMTLLKTLHPEQLTEYKTFLADYTCEFTPLFAKVLKIKINPLVALPNWHEAKGKPAWIMIDEVFLN